MKKRFLTYSLIATLLLPALLQQEAEANESTQTPVNFIKAKESQEVLKRSKIKAEDIYKQTELSMTSEQASFTKLADWAIVDLILEGKYGDTDNEIKSRLIKEKHDVESIMDSVRQARLENIKKAKPIITDFQYVKKVEIPEKKVSYETGSAAFVGQGGRSARKLIAILDEDGNETLVIGEKETSSLNSESEQAEVSEKTNVIPAYPHREFKSYMSWTALHPESTQGKFSAQAVADPETAIMTYNGRYLVALGSAYADHVGQEIDIVMESGQIIHAVVGDFKAAEHTDQYGSTQRWDGSVVEFVVSSNSEAAKVTKGTGSYNIIFPGKVKEFRK